MGNLLEAVDLCLALKAFGRVLNRSNESWQASANYVELGLGIIRCQE